MTPFTFADFKKLINGLPSKGDTIAVTVNGYPVDVVTCTKDGDAWHIDLHPHKEEW